MYTSNYCQKTIEKKWQKKWEQNNCFESKIDQNKKKYYVLSMFPYPSGKLHVGHVRNYSIGDVISRFKAMQGFNILHPMGWDAFGLPAENAAIDNNISPEKWTYNNISNMKNQMKALGMSYDWNREVITCDPQYYKHEQLFFLKLLKNNLAYKKITEVNWDPVENTVLANEQVIDGKGWRSNAVIQKKALSQWFIKITNYQEELLECIQDLTNWPHHVRELQKNWIGKTKGFTAKLKIDSTSDQFIEIFTDNLNKINHCEFLSIGTSHRLINTYFEKDIKIQNFVSKAKIDAYNQEIGYKTDIYVINPLNKHHKIPIFITNLSSNYKEYAKLGCASYCVLDAKFAKNHLNIDIKDKQKKDSTNDIRQSLQNTSCEIEEKTLYKIQDWGISRQRFWGCPIPIIYCKKCGTLPVQEKDLPVVLPNLHKVSSNGNYLDQHPTWKHTICYKCNNEAVRETDTFDTFFESSWYFLHFCSASKDIMIKEEECNYWMPVNHYIGGIEHATGHLLYARFFTKALRDNKYFTNLSEPFSKLSTQGMVLHPILKDTEDNYVYPDDVVENKDGKLIHKDTKKHVIAGKIEKMSKSKKNLVDVDKSLNEYGADAIRLFVLSDSPPENDIEWSTKGIQGAKRFINNLYKLAHTSTNTKYDHKEDNKLESLLNKTIQEVTNYIENTKFNKAISSLRILYNTVTQNNNKRSITVKKTINSLAIMLNPFIPHITEEMWEIMQNTTILANTKWPSYTIQHNTQNEEITYIVQINSKVKEKLKIDLTQEKEQIILNAQALPKIKKALETKKIIQTIFVKNKVINFVIK